MNRDKYIGSELMLETRYERKIDIEVAMRFINDNTIEMLRNKLESTGDNIISATVSNVSKKVSSARKRGRKGKESDITSNTETRPSKRAR
ncbi:hypothetical protein LPJ73_000377 [Coemansia sp. RSA 2703]|nr:hypothetical protein LPJ73_000377 [Coemansia sp. RSA 2703]